MLLFVGSVMAQSTVSGTVTGEDGSPVGGATVLVKGTSAGAYTDQEGKFSLSVPEGATTLVVSFYGFETSEVEIGGQSSIDIQLASSITTLDEVVVTGYGTQRAKEVTSAIASVKAEDFNQGNVNDVAQLLQGKVAGLSIAKPGGNPNQSFNIRLRGLSSVGANAGPLVVIDGVIGANLESLDPNDIESIDVLKDGSAAAIYGTRGNAGVLLVTTKQGKAGRTTVNYSGYVTAEEVGKFVDVMSADEYRSIILPTGNGEDFGSNTDWFDELTQTGLTHVHNLALSGGTGQTTFRASVNYRDIEGIAINTGFRQLNARLNLTQRAFNDKLTITFNIANTTRDEERGFDEAFRYATIYNPTAPIRDESNAEFNNLYDGYYQNVLFDYFNPVAILEQNRNEGLENRLNGNVYAELQILPGLKIGGRYAIQRENNNGFIYYDKQSFWRGRDRNGLASIREDRNVNQLAEATVNYSTTVGDLNLEFLAGYSYQEFENSGFGAEGGDFLTDAFGFDNLGASLDFANGRGDIFSYRNENKLIAGFGRAVLNYKGTYFLSASYRREGSTKFGANNKWGDFPAVSAGVTLSNLFEIPAVTNLKLRASYGVTGAVPNDSYLSLPRIGSLSDNFFFGGAYVPAFGPRSNPNPDLKWERKAEYDIGIDFSLFDDRLSGSFDYYNRTTNDLLFEVNVPVPPNLVNTSIVNIGELQSQGFEALINFDAIQGPDNGFTWTTGLNFSTFDVELVSLSNDDFDFGGFRLIANLGSPGQNNTPLIRVEEGQPVGNIWGQNLLGIEGGQWIFEDLDGDGDTDNDADDAQVLGNGLPDVEFGWNNTFTFGNFDLNFFIRGALGHDLVNTFRAFYEVVSPSYNSVNTENFNNTLLNNAIFNSSHVEDASFIKLDNATLGYTIPLGSSSIFTRARVYINGQNLFFITDYTGVDPEVRAGDPRGDGTIDILAPGIDRRNTWFRTRSYTVGVNLTF
ncbi:MAG: SusC/RagA family TonB-linked outer membrane protein [Bacteroidota bacterium]